MPLKDIKAVDVVPNGIAQDSPSAGKIVTEIKKAFAKGVPVCLDFTGVRVIFPSFLSAVITPLYENFDAGYIDNNLNIVIADSRFVSVIRSIKEQAKRWYHPEYGKIIRQNTIDFYSRTDD